MIVFALGGNEVVSRESIGNVGPGMSMLGERMGLSKLYKALHGFDFGQPTGIELPGVAALTEKA